MLYRPSQQHFEAPLFGQPRPAGDGVGEHIVADHGMVGQHPLASRQLIENVARKSGPHHLVEKNGAGARYHY